MDSRERARFFTQIALVEVIGAALWCSFHSWGDAAGFYGLLAGGATIAEVMVTFLP